MQRERHDSHARRHLRDCEYPESGRLERLPHGEIRLVGVRVFLARVRRPRRDAAVGREAHILRARSDDFRHGPYHRQQQYPHAERHRVQVVALHHQREQRNQHPRHVYPRHGRRHRHRALAVEPVVYHGYQRQPAAKPGAERYDDERQVEVEQRVVYGVERQDGERESQPLEQPQIPQRLDAR